MTIARKQQISLQHTPYYHCTTRCVRQAFLCGDDHYSGQNFDHRKQWLEDRLALLSTIFAIDLVAYAIMSNHYHVVVRLRGGNVVNWTDEEVVQRWGRVFSIPDDVSTELIDIWRQRLCDLSWYMRCVNEPMARAANREDGRRGRFWEGRFRCQALLDESALLKCMAYVDLNPIRAAQAQTPETSDHTSIKARIEGRDCHLLSFAGEQKAGQRSIPIRRQEYLQLVDWSGRQIRHRKRGRIPRDLPPILDRLDVSGKAWMDEMRYYGRWYYRAVGSLKSLQRYCQYLDLQWLKGQSRAAAAC